MKKILLFAVLAIALVSFTQINTNKVVLRDIDGTLLKSYPVVNKSDKSVTFTVDKNTSVSSAVIDGKFKIFLVENGSSNKAQKHTLKIKGKKGLSFDNYFETSFDVASSSEIASSTMMPDRPIWIIMD